MGGSRHRHDLGASQSDLGPSQIDLGASQSDLGPRQIDLCVSHFVYHLSLSLSFTKKKLSYISKTYVSHCGLCVDNYFLQCKIKIL